MGPYDETNSMLAGGSDFGSPPPSIPSGESSGWEKALGIGANILGTMYPWLGTLYNVWQQNKTNKQNREFAQQMAEYQNQMNLAQWQRETQYNSPEEQMQRLKDAGLNPDLIYGSSGMQGSNAAASSPYMVAPSDYGGAVAPQVNPLLESNVKNLDSRTELNEAHVRLSDAQIERYAHENGLTDVNVSYMRTQMGYIETLSDYYVSLTNLTDSTARKTFTEHQYIALKLSLLTDTYDEEVKALKAKYGAEAQYAAAYFGAKVGLLESEKSLNEASRGLSQSRKKYIDESMDSLISILKSKASIADKQAQMIAYISDHQGADWWIKNITSILNTIFNGVDAFVP